MAPIGRNSSLLDLSERVRLSTGFDTTEEAIAWALRRGIQDLQREGFDPILTPRSARECLRQLMGYSVPVNGQSTATVYQCFRHIASADDKLSILMEHSLQESVAVRINKEKCLFAIRDGSWKAANPFCFTPFGGSIPGTNQLKGKWSEYLMALPGAKTGVIQIGAGAHTSVIIPWSTINTVMCDRNLDPVLIPEIVEV
jgi:hypothetical protein